ncbi:MAG: hypothetical protein QM774_12600 [Gordonia sp. (in: high G+C Gram-positive bacteria)]|uniref:hypothetical protein n=1 Tax=Gordonia sp. (in: high G+C Gram-positive bacteria) TaxID=84139 RepID=UPI0039E401CE
MISEEKITELRELCREVSSGVPLTQQSLRSFEDDSESSTWYIATHVYAERILLDVMGDDPRYSVLASYVSSLYPVVKSTIGCGIAEFQFSVDCILKMKPSPPLSLIDETADQRESREALAGWVVFLYGIDVFDNECWSDFVDVLIKVDELARSNYGLD